MSQAHVQKFEASMFEYCSNNAERAYKLIEDGEIDVGLEQLGHLADILQMLRNSKNSSGTISINTFAQEVRVLDEIDKDAVYTHLQENGFGQYISE
jgi:flagellin-specific chaperone FliS